MKENRGLSKLEKITISMTFLILVFASIRFIKGNNESSNTSSGVFNDIVTNFSIGETNNVNTDTILEELDFDSDIVQKLIPFTGAYPSNDLIYITKIRNMKKEDITNDFILKLAFSKVTKDDWSNSYVAEGEMLNIDASILDNYVKSIFGNIEYEKADFNNTDLVLENTVSSLYDIKYNKDEDKYYININAGDGVEDSFIEYLYPKAVKYDDRIEISIHPIYIKNYHDNSNSGEDGFYYIAYKHYNYETNAFISRLTDNMNEVWQVNDDGKAEYNKLIQNIQEKDLETYIFTYKLNEENNSYEFESLISK